MERSEVPARLSNLIGAVDRPHLTRMAMDGVDAAGKRGLAEELAGHVERRGRPVIRASVERFHNPRAVRMRRRPDSPEGYYHDSFDYGAGRSCLLVPLGPGGDRRYRKAVFDFRTDSPVISPVQIALTNAILLSDGVLLLRPELAPYWDYTIFIEASFAVTVERGAARDQDLFGDAAGVRERQARRYVPGQRLYLAEARPADRANIIILNDNPSDPEMRINRMETETRERSFP